jgi:type II secretory pathway pseudopilin PulG
MEIWDILITLAFLLLAVIAVGGILGIVGFFLALGAKRQINELRSELKAARSAAGAIQPGRAAAAQAPGAPVPAGPPPVPEAPAAAAAPPAAPSAPTLEPVAAGAMPAWSAAVGRVATASAPGASASPPRGTALGGLESTIGKRWIAWAGAIVLFVGVAFFLKYAFDNDWIGPTGQVVIGILAGIAFLAAGSRCIGKGWRIFGQTIIGLGLAILYAANFAAFSAYEPPVMSQNVAFGCMVAVTAAGVALAVLYDALPMAMLAVLGGLLTPWLLSTGKDARDSLFTYLLLLDLGVLAVAFFRGWRLLDALALAGTFVLYGGWYDKFYDYKPAGMAPALAWLGAFYAVFLALPFVYHLVRRIRFTIERFIMALANAAFAFGMAWAMLHKDYAFSLGFVALGMAAAYLVLGSIIRRRLPEDAPTLFGAIAMTVTFLTLAVPLQLHANGILLAWAMEGPILAYLGYRFRYLPVRAFAAAVLVVAIGRLFFSSDTWPLHEGHYVLLLNREFLTAMMVPLAMGLYAVVHHWQRGGSAALDRAMKLAGALLAGLLAMVVASAELGGWVEDMHGNLAAIASVTALWALGAVAYLQAGRSTRAAAWWIWGAGALVWLVAAVFGMASFGQYAGVEHRLVLNVRFGACLLVVLAAFAYGRAVMRARLTDVNLSRIVGWVCLSVGMAGLLVLLSSEAYSYCQDTISTYTIAPIDPLAGELAAGQASIPDYTNAYRAGQMSVTVIWGVYAVGLLVIGFWRRLRVLRLAGLGLFALAAGKLVLVDLTGVQDIYRIVSFVALGLLMVAASYLYHRLERRLPAIGPAPVAPAGADGPAGAGANGETS